MSKKPLYLRSCMCMRHAFVCMCHACVCMHHACMCDQCSCMCILSSYVRVCVHQFIRMHAPACIRIQNPMYECTGHVFFFPFFLSNHDSYALFHLFLQVLPSFTGRGSTSHFSSQYRALMDDIKALVHRVGFEPIISLLPKSSTSGILVKTLAKRW